MPETPRPAAAIPPSAVPPAGDAQAIIDAMRGMHGLEAITLDDVSRTIAAVPRDLELRSLKRYVDEYRVRPERRRGISRVQDLASLIAQTNRFKDADSLLFASRDPQQPALMAVINYHRAGAEADDRPRFGDHRIVYPFPLADEWRAWTGQHGAKLSQGDFAAYLEDRILDVLPPPESGDLTDERFPGLAQMTRLITSSWASPTTLVELSRGLSVRVGARVKEVRNLSTGEAQVQYETEHHDEGGAPLKVPQLFLIGIPVFDAGPAYRIAVRLRYRVSGPQITWSYELWRADLAFRHAFEEACRTARDETGLDLVYGAPEEVG
jgi:hypothetical protein